MCRKPLNRFSRPSAVGKGTGLGLFLSRETVLAHGGSLMLESETGRGHDRNRNPTWIEERADARPRIELMQPARILVADDDAVARDLWLRP